MNELHPGLVTAAATTAITLGETDFPLPAPGECLCVITSVTGPSYRPLGAAMVVASDGSRRGSLSSGCIEADVVRHAITALRQGRGTVLRYGKGSPFMDLQLPCGGGLEVTLVPDPGAGQIAAARRNLRNRQDATLTLPSGQRLLLRPRPHLMILGSGPEAAALFAMARAGGMCTDWHCSAAETPPGAHALTGTGWPERLIPDARTAIALFFHDHHQEPPLLARALTSPAFYIGALGSARAHADRCAALGQMGLGRAQTDRMAWPFGLVAHARDPQAIAAGVLAQIHDHARLF
ncbi:MAG: XdhC family protein [Paracoccus sp. (in: a-proteobacteria)]|uniref:XdhC family protein n=1 Tax=Paracoccus sp. TaxID=267 RepID=UPI0026DF56BF|nr:XdhC family protein [Paracoccus sp. (in: a-proteobacteria)]MDO5622988.1 XdhC family protein [Paracoccus sp. (in: a-proteobacteria)]